MILVILSELCWHNSIDIIYFLYPLQPLTYTVHTYSFKALFENDTKFEVQKYNINDPEAKDRLAEKIDFRKLSRLEKDLENQSISEKPQYLIPKPEIEK